MKKNIILLVCFMLILVACKQDTVDGSSLRKFQSSTNDMASELSTLQQIKFNEALYIIKKFGVEGENDTEELTAMAKLLQGKNTADIFSIADNIAEKEGLEWRSTAPPSLGKMKIFDYELSLDQVDPNDVKAEQIIIQTKTASSDSLVGVKAIKIIPVLVDNNGNPVIFEGAALETTMQIISGGQKIYTSKNIIQNNNFKGFTLSFSALSENKIVDGTIDIQIEVNTKNKKLTMTKIGELVNIKALKPIANKDEDDVDQQTSPDIEANATEGNNTTETTKQNPKNIVRKFLNNVGGQNLKAAYEAANNPQWGNYDNFSNPNSGFGNVKSIQIKSIEEKNNNGDKATINASYEVIDKNGNTVTVNASFGLKNTNGEWKIVNYSL